MIAALAPTEMSGVSDALRALDAYQDDGQV